MSKVQNNEANAKDSKYEVKLTEWELDTLAKAINACQFPGTHVDLVYKLKKKLEESWASLQPSSLPATPKQ